MKVSVDLLSKNLYIPINNPQGSGVDFSSLSGEKTWCLKETFVKYRQTQGKRFDPRGLTFFDQKRYGYLSPGISFSEFKTQAEHFGIEKFPFFTDKKASETAKSELMRIIFRGA